MECVRCNSCDKLLAKAVFIKISIKCGRCKTVNIFEHQLSAESECLEHLLNGDATHGIRK